MQKTQVRPLTPQDLQQLSHGITVTAWLCATAKQLQLLNPSPGMLCQATKEATAEGSLRTATREQPSLSAARESLRGNEDPAQAEINK